MSKADSVAQKQRAFELLSSGMSKAAICRRDDMPSRPTLNVWIKEGMFTNGVNWEVFIEEKERQKVAELREAALAQRAGDDRHFLEQVKDFVKGDAFDAVKAAIQAGDVEVTIGDLDKLTRLYAMLDADANGRMELISWFARKMSEIVIEIMDERQFALFRSRALALEHEVNLKLNPLAHSDAVKKVAG